MPNWVTNILKFKGNSEAIAKMKGEIRGDGDQVIDFHKILPLPKELAETTSPTRIISQAEYDEQERRIATGELKEDEKKWGVMRCLTEELVKEYERKFGTADWYDWCVNNWGTKWNASNVSEIEGGFKFDTAWSNPYKLLVKLSEKYPNITFSVKYADEDLGNNVGWYELRGGKEISGFIPDVCSYAAYTMGMEIKYGSVAQYFESNDFIFTDDIEEEDFDDYYETMVDIAYNADVVPFEDCGWNKKILMKFREAALADENYKLGELIDRELEK